MTTQTDASESAEPRPDFFISYNQADRSWAEWIAWQLEGASYTTMLQAWDFRPGDNFVVDMLRAAAAQRTIAVLSPDYLTALYTQSEWAAAFVQDPTGARGVLLPVRVRPYDVPQLLSAIVHIDLVGLEAEAAREQLLAGVRRERVKPSQPPGFPGGSSSGAPPRFPGALPPIWNVPHLPTLHFSGREQLLAELETALKSGRPAALTGLGGVGKTKLATEYAYRHAGDYEVVWWIRAERPKSHETETSVPPLAADYAALARELHLPEGEAPNQNVMVDAVRVWLRQHAAWLLVFDNAEQPADVRPYLPQASSGHVLVTSRNPVWGALAQPFSVRAWPPDEAIAFLLKRTGQADPEGASNLAEPLGYLPLALEHAAAYIEESPQSFAAYLDLFRHRQEVLDWMPCDSDYPATIAATWSLAFQSVQAAAPEGAELLNVCAFLAPEAIPIGLIREGAEQLAPAAALAAAVGDALRWNAAMAHLRRYSLVDVATNVFSVHRLVQAVARDRLPEETRQTWAAAAVNLVSAAFPSDPHNLRSWPKCAELLPHALAAAGHAEALRVASEPTGLLLNQVGLYLQARAEFPGARALFERALRIGEATLGPDHPTAAHYLRSLGGVLRAQGEFATAKKYLELALRIDTSALPEHPEAVAMDLNNLGLVLQDEGDLAGARAHLEQALRIDEDAWGPEHPEVAMRLGNLGRVLQDQGDLAGARLHLERALRIMEQTHPPDHPKVAAAANHLGDLLRAQGDLVNARQYLERALRIMEAEATALGTDHPDLASTAENLGRVLQAQGDLSGAQALYERALRFFQTCLGEDDPSTVRVRNHLQSVDV